MREADDQRAGVHVALAITALHGVSGGAERVLVDVANGLFRRGYDVSVLTTQDHNGFSFYPLDYGIKHLDGKPRHTRQRSGPRLGGLSVPAQRRRGLAVALWALRYGPRIRHLRRLLRVARPDVVIGFLPSSFTYLEIAAAGSTVKTIASLHNVPDRDLGGDPDRWDQNPVDVWARRRALRTSDANTVLLPSFRAQLESDVQDKTWVIPNMVHPYDGCLADVSTSEDNVILTVGRLSPAKDQATLIRAWATLAPKYPRWRVRIVGDGLLHDELVDLIDELGVERLTMDGPTANIDEVYARSTYFVTPSLYEGFGLVTAEAMRCGLPAIGFADCEGTNELIVDDENGLLVDPGEDRVRALAEAMERLIQDEPLRRRLAARAPETIERFSPEPVLDAWDALISELIAESVLP